jgi:hypothetical protein
VAGIVRDWRIELVESSGPLPLATGPPRGGFSGMRPPGMQRA